MPYNPLRIEDIVYSNCTFIVHLSLYTYLNEQGILPRWQLVCPIYIFYQTILHVIACEQMLPYCLPIKVEQSISV